jgi:hypothetical protein
MLTGNEGDKKYFTFTGYSPTPEPIDEFEGWVEKCPVPVIWNELYVNGDTAYTTEIRKEFKDWLRKMPREKP